MNEREFDTDSFHQYFPPDGVFRKCQPDGMPEGLLQALDEIIDQTGFDIEKYQETYKRHYALFENALDFVSNSLDVSLESISEPKSLEEDIYELQAPIFEKMLERGYSRKDLQRQVKEVVYKLYKMRKEQANL